MTPFAMTRSADGRVHLQRFSGDLEEGQARARAAVRAAAGDTAQAAVAWDGYLTGGDRRIDAVFVEASGSGEGSIVVAQPYHRLGALRKRWETFGDPVLVAHGGPLY